MMTYDVDMEERRSILAEDGPVVLYHGSNVVVRHPEVKVQGYYKDFGFGFYCTNIEMQAKRWVQN